MAIIISSQTFRDEAIVAAKLAIEDFTVTLTPVFEIDGVEYQAIIDGHHSFSAALEAGVEPEYIVATEQDDDRIALLSLNVDDYLLAARNDSNWHDAEMGWEVF